MNVLKNVWSYLNGKKTLLGTVLFFAAVEAQRYGLVNTDLLATWDAYAQQAATVLAVVGLLHKGVKVVRGD